jgi:cysteine-rich repeat protein
MCKFSYFFFLLRLLGVFRGWVWKCFFVFSFLFLGVNGYAAPSDPVCVCTSSEAPDWGICMPSPMEPWQAGDHSQDMNGVQYGDRVWDCGSCGVIRLNESQYCSVSPDPQVDTIPPQCTSEIFPETWVQDRVGVRVADCTDTGSVVSRCDRTSETEVFVYNHGATGQARVSDWAGNEAVCTSSDTAARIDRLIPEWQGTGVRIRNTGKYESESTFQWISDALDTETVLTVDTAFQIVLDVADRPAGLDGVGYQSGQSGVDWEYSYFSLAGPSGAVSGMLRDLQAIEGITVMPNSSDPTEITEILIEIERNADLLYKSGSYVVRADVRDLAGNWAESRSLFRFMLVAGDPVLENSSLSVMSYTLEGTTEAAADCGSATFPRVEEDGVVVENGLLADMTDRCTFQLSLRDVFGNPVGEMGAEPAHFCGDGILDPGEECDDGNGINTDECTNYCTTAVVGDCFVQSGVEDCDDCNVLDGDGCSARGALASEFVSPVCDSSYFSPDLCFDINFES